jgi:radical SAM protein with 4Fe4S-binding SPASM domain
MYYILKDRYLLRGWEKLPYAIVDRQRGTPIFIRREEFDVVSLCNGMVNMDLPVISSKSKEMVAAMEKNGFVEARETQSRLLPVQEYRLYPNRYIKTAHWSITGKCNYKCKHCYMSAPDAKLGELSHDVIMDIIRQLADAGVMNVTITGGEPLIRRDFLEIVDALLEKGINIQTIYSNGKLVTDKLLDELEARGIHPEFNMSYDGLGHHDWLRGIDGAEQAVEQAFLRCRDRGFPTGAEMCLHQNNKHTLRDSLNRLASWGCSHVKTNPISNVGAWLEGGYGEAISKAELYQLYLDYIPQYYEDGMPLGIMLGGFFSASPRNPDKFMVPLQKNCEDPEKMCICGHARQVMYISAEGRALPCMALSGMDIQNEFPLITEAGLTKCLTDSRYMRLIDTRVSEYFALHPECVACEYAKECIGGCRAAALETTPDDIMGKDTYACEMFLGGWKPRIYEAAQAGMEIYRQKYGEKQD